MDRRKFLSSTLKTISAASCGALLPTARAIGSTQYGGSGASSSASMPQLAITIDDPTVLLETGMKWPEANSRILKAIASRDVRAAVFVCGHRVDDSDGVKLVTAWDQSSHMICNHTYSHLAYTERTSYADYAVDFLKNEKSIAGYRNRTQMFRYPFLKEGDTAQKRDQFRALLKERGYRVGHVTIDASDWYVNQRYADRLAKEPKTQVGPYSDYLIAHLLDRAGFYRQLALDVLGRDIRHTLLIHYNALNALVLGDVMSAFERAGWQWIDASLAFEDPVFRSQPKTVPAGESLIWALAKESGRFESRLRYPGEDGDYEKPKLDALGL